MKFNLKRETLFKNSTQVLFLRILGMILAYVSMLLISNLYGAEVFGRYSLALTSLQFLILFASLGITTSVVKLTADRKNFDGIKPLNQYLSKSVVLLLLSSVLTSILIYSTKDFFAIKVFKDPELVNYFTKMAYLFGGCLFFTFLVEYVRGRQKFIQYGFFIYIVPNALLIGFLLYFSKLNQDSSNSFFSYLLALSITFFGLLVYFPFKKINKKTNHLSYSNLLNLSLPMMFSSAFVFILNWTDVFMLGSMTTKEDLGIYNAAYKLSILVVVIINAFNTVLGPKIANFYGRGDLQSIKREVQKATRIITLLSIPIALVLVFFRKQLLLLFGSEFIHGEIVLITFSLGLLVNAMTGSVGLVLNMTSYQKTFRNINLFGVIMNIFLNFVLIKLYGINGAAYASIATSIILNIVCLMYVKNKFGFYTFKLI
jgi:O-antigen/teichoic acid export membrane protein